MTRLNQAVIPVYELTSLYSVYLYMNKYQDLQNMEPVLFNLINIIGHVGNLIYFSPILYCKRKRYQYTPTPLINVLSCVPYNDVTCDTLLLFLVYSYCKSHILYLYGNYIIFRGFCQLAEGHKCQQIYLLSNECACL